MISEKLSLYRMLQRMCDDDTPPEWVLFKCNHDWQQFGSGPVHCIKCGAVV